MGKKGGKMGNVFWAVGGQSRGALKLPPTHPAVRRYLSNPPTQPTHHTPSLNSLCSGGGGGGGAAAAAAAAAEREFEIAGKAGWVGGQQPQKQKLRLGGWVLELIFFLPFSPKKYY